MCQASAKEEALCGWVQPMLRFWLTAPRGTSAALTCCMEALHHYLSPHRWTSKPPAWAGLLSSWVILLPPYINSRPEMSLLSCSLSIIFSMLLPGFELQRLTSRWSSNPGSAQPYLTLESKQNPVCLPQHNSHKLNFMALPWWKFFCGWCNFSIWSAVFDVCWRQVQLGWRAYVPLLKSNLGFFWGDINSWLYCAGHAR